MIPRPRADRVRSIAGLKQDFFKRHRKDATRAEAAWRALVGKTDALLQDPQLGEPIPNRLRPQRFESYPSLYLIPELPFRFRAIYELSSASPLEPLDVTIVWVGSHAEYDRLFGYQTS